MARTVEEILEDLLKEQKDISLYTLTLERDRLFGALMQAGLGVIVITANEFILAPGVTGAVVQLTPPGFVYLSAGPADWYTSLPWWCSYSLWVDQTAPAVPFATATRMPETLQVDTRAILPFRGFSFHQVTNLHVATTAYCMVKNFMFMVSTETWDMIRAVYLDAMVERVRKKALEISGIER